MKTAVAFIFVLNIVVFVYATTELEDGWCLRDILRRKDTKIARHMVGFNVYASECMHNTPTDLCKTYHPAKFGNKYHITYERIGGTTNPHENTTRVASHGSSFVIDAPALALKFKIRNQDSDRLVQVINTVLTGCPMNFGGTVRPFWGVYELIIDGESFHYKYDFNNCKKCTTTMPDEQWEQFIKSVTGDTNAKHLQESQKTEELGSDLEEIPLEQ